MEDEEAARLAKNIFAAGANLGLYNLVVHASARGGPGPIHIDVTIERGGKKYRSLRELVDAVIEAPARAARCLLYTSPSPRDRTRSRMPSSA